MMIQNGINGMVMHQPMHVFRWSFDTIEAREPVKVSMKLLPIGNGWEQKGWFLRSRGQQMRFTTVIDGLINPNLRKAFPHGCNYVGLETQNPALIPVARFIAKNIEENIEEQIKLHKLSRALPSYSVSHLRKHSIYSHDEWSLDVDFNPHPIAQGFMPIQASAEQLMAFAEDVSREFEKIVPDVKALIREYTHLQPSFAPSKAELARMLAIINAAFKGETLPEEAFSSFADQKEEEEFPVLMQLPEVVDYTALPDANLYEKKDHGWKFFSADGRTSLDVSIKLLTTDSWRCSDHTGQKDVETRRIQISIKGFEHPYLSKAEALDGYGFGGYVGDYTKNPAFFPVANYISNELHKTLSVKMLERGLDKSVPEVSGQDAIKIHMSGSDKISQQVDFNPDPSVQGEGFILASDKNIMGLLQDVELRMGAMLSEVKKMIAELEYLQPPSNPSDFELHGYSAIVRMQVAQEKGMNDSRSSDAVLWQQQGLAPNHATAAVK